MKRWGILSLAAAVVVSGCSQERGAHGRWNGEVATAADVVQIAEGAEGAEGAKAAETQPSSASGQRSSDVSPINEPEQDAAPAPIENLQSDEIVEKADALTAFFQAEQAVHTELRERALATVRVLIAEHEQKIPLFEQGPELQWHPSLGVVSARERTIRYDTNALTARIRTTGDPDRPFVINVMVPCQIYGRSGKGIAVVGDLPKPTEVLIAELPLPTRRTDLDALPEALRAPVDEALASCAAAESVIETVQAGVTLAYDRASDAVVLVHGRDDVAATSE